MSVASVLLPVFALIALTFFLSFRMAASRVGSAKAGEVKVKEIAVSNDAWPDRVKQISNAFHNQLEMPLLFYALVAFAMITRKDDFLFVIMSWIFVASRFAHAWVHITSNRVPLRFNLFALGLLVLIAMWVIFAVHILAGV